MPITSHFPTFIYYENLFPKKKKEFTTDLLKECYQFKKIDKSGQKWSEKNYPGGYTSYQSISNLHQVSSTFADLEKQIRKHCYRFAKHLDYDLKGKELVMTDFWMNIMPKSVIHPMHLHPLSTISGTYYVSAPKGTSSISFEDPRLDRFMAQPQRKERHKSENAYYKTIQPQDGKLVLFESWLRHQVGANPSNKDRVSVSFNYHWA